jgi:hypothetical protein
VPPATDPARGVRDTIEMREGRIVMSNLTVDCAKPNPSGSLMGAKDPARVALLRAGGVWMRSRSLSAVTNSSTVRILASFDPRLPTNVAPVIDMVKSSRPMTVWGGSEISSRNEHSVSARQSLPPSLDADTSFGGAW